MVEDESMYDSDENQSINKRHSTPVKRKRYRESQNKEFSSTKSDDESESFQAETDRHDSLIREKKRLKTTDNNNDSFSSACSDDSETNVDSDEDKIHENETNEDYETDQQSETSNPDELVADCGTIESMTLINFMCHDHFEISFNPRVNFVIGKNGSGKSAILTAIVIVLGGRATNTGRSQSLVNFIKNGKTSAKITIKMCNYSPFKKKTFKYSEYGKSIIVDRIIKSDGSSNYVLKSASGKIISRKKEELNEIINLFSIQIENPVCILSQEVSRNFLNSKSERDKYDFFMKATNLEQLRQSYAFALQQSKQAKDILAKKKSFLPAIEKEVRELEKKVDVFQKFNQKKDQLEFLKCEWLWAGVKELEKLEADPPKVIKELDNKIDDCNERLEAIKKDCLELERIRDDFDGSIQDEYNDEIEKLNLKKDNLNKRLEELRRSRCEKSLKINELNFSISNCNKDKVQLQKKIDDIKEQIAEREKLIAEQERIKAKRVELQGEQDETKMNIAKLRKDKQVKQDEHNKLTDSIKSLNYKTNKLRSELSNKDNLLKNLKGSNKNSLAKFGQPYVRLVQIIEEENRKGRFKHKPIGPLGNYIKLKDDHISTALETCLKGLMFAFLCDNFGDAEHLGKLIKSVNFQHQQQPMILRRRFRQRFDIRNAVEVDRYKSLLHYVTIENDQVFNIIMDKSNLDQTLYIPVDNNAIELLMNNENRLPPNLKMAYSATGTQFYPKKNGSNFRQYSTNKKASGILNSDTSLMIRKVETEINDLSDNIKQMLEEKSELEASAKELNVELKEFEREIDRNHSKMNNISKQLYELSSVKEFKPEDLDIFEGDYQACIDQLTKFKEDLQTTKEDVKDTEEKIKIVKNDQNLNNQDIQDCKERFDAFKKKIRENEFLLKKNNENIEKIEKRIEEFNERKEIQMQKLTEITCKKEDAIKVAKEVHERIDTNRQPDVIEKEMNDLKKFISENENRLGNLEELSKSYIEKKAHLDKTVEHVQFLEKYIFDFSESIRKRAKIYVKLRNHITAETAERFSKTLKLLNFTGTLSIYHQNVEIDGKIKKARSLDINVNPKSSDPNKLYKDTRSLSGGERSYSTVAFLIALWESSYSPFNILDEVDVFMDRLTRNIALDNLIDSANKKQGKQYIFLSPLRPEKKDINNLLKIFYMPEPRRVDQASP